MAKGDMQGGMSGGFGRQNPGQQPGQSGGANPFSMMGPAIGMFGSMRGSSVPQGPNQFATSIAPPSNFMQGMGQSANQFLPQLQQQPQVMPQPQQPMQEIQIGQGGGGNEIENFRKMIMQQGGFQPQSNIGRGSPMTGGQSSSPWAGRIQTMGGRY